MELDDAYAVGAYISGAEKYPPRWQKRAESFRSEHPDQAEISYGNSARQVMDVFRPDGLAKGLFVFVHGGYWMEFDKSSWSHLAEGMLGRGWAVAIPSYDLCPEVTIAEITQQISAAITAAAGRFDGPILLAGHSAGGHLVARMVCLGVLPEAVADRLGHVMPISPLGDLRPLLRTSMNETLGLDATSAKAESPRLHAGRHAVPVTAWVGSDERPAFLDQARWLAGDWNCRHVVEDGKHHFDVIDALAEKDSYMVRVLVGEA